ncbi:MAG TPA: hypothetical protein VMZ27_15740 [Candidatus Saccharimonadales bacterium]|nr:hypothetical protein [Candidatus Saccharimonadales bacterium]
MKNSSDKLERLFRQARSAEPAGAESPSGYWQTRVLAHWEPSNAQRELLWSALHRNVRRGVICAAVFMGICILWSLNAPLQDTEADFDLASYELRVDGMP